MYRKTYAAVNERTLTENVRELVSHYPEYQTYFGVVKGNAYGHGFRVVNALLAGGVNYLAVSSLEEALCVREFNREVPILCLEPVDLQFLDVVIANRITLTVHSADYFRALNQAAPQEKVRVHVKLDTGMNRLGLKTKDEVDTLFSVLDRHENVLIEGIYTHLATTGILDPYYDQQMKKFERLTENIDLSLIPIVHVGRSTTLVHHKKPDFVNGVRMGICMYGFSQSMPVPTGWRKLKRELTLKFKGISPAILQNDLNLKTALSLHSAVLQVKDVKKGEFIGYGANARADEDLTVAILGIGYYDGMDARIGSVRLNGKDCPIWGDICMDMTAVKAPKGTREGDLAEIFGETVSVRKIAQKLGTNAYHVLTGVTTRVERVYTEDI